jgi:(E)-4-hydroxy-3-methylbut-2-enyl-diphosphate synthase
MLLKRQKTKPCFVGKVPIGCSYPISIQSMTNTKTTDIAATILQINQLADAGADVVRVSVNDTHAANSLPDIIKQSPVPIVADIHFNHKLAIKSIEAGISKIRINPGNIGSEDKIKCVLDAAKLNNIPIRIGVNSGSLEKDILQKYRSPTAEALFQSAIRHVQIANKFNFDDIILSVKSSAVTTTIEAYRLLAKSTNYPLHLGVTEAGSIFTGTIKSTVALSVLLAEGIGDTIRISLTGDPVKEVEAGIELLAALGLRKKHIDLISCPTCGRVEINTIDIVNELESLLVKIKTNKTLKVAIMGCVVNGPGEAKEADIAIACGKKGGVLYVDGIEQKHIAPDEIVKCVLEEVEKKKKN